MTTAIDEYRDWLAHRAEDGNASFEVLYLLEAADALYKAADDVAGDEESDDDESVKNLRQVLKEFRFARRPYAYEKGSR